MANKPMITNFRVGFATNSSSSHSVVLIPDSMMGKVDDVGGPSDYGYQWQWFRLVSPEMKLRYLAAQLFTTIFHNNRDSLNKALIKYFPEVSEIDQDELSVDHQSMMTPPPFPPTDSYVDAIVKMFLSSNVAVIGGNDNSDMGEPEREWEKHPIIGHLMGSSFGTLCRFEENRITIFEKATGQKLRMTFDGSSFTKGSAPELVDLKITDFCDAGCSFCYQGSTEQGRHANIQRIQAIANLLNEVGVFEVAIGGGEPTKHPKFAEILQIIGMRGMVPNFTTFNSDWISNKEVKAAVSRFVGGIGVSCLSVKDMEKARAIRSIFPHRRNDKPIVTVQHVLGSVPLDVTGSLMETAFNEGFPVLMLGFKETGFGKGYRRHDHGDVPLFLKLAVGGCKSPQLSVDTALVDQWPGLCEALGAPEALVTSPEGKFSCYIDAVKKTVAPSSYSGPETVSALPATKDEFLKVFTTY